MSPFPPCVVGVLDKLHPPAIRVLVQGCRRAPLAMTSPAPSDREKEAWRGKRAVPRHAGDSFHHSKGLLAHPITKEMLSGRDAPGFEQKDNELSGKLE